MPALELAPVRAFLFPAKKMTNYTNGASTAPHSSTGPEGQPTERKANNATVGHEYDNDTPERPEKPIPLAVNIEKIPQDLKDAPNWVLWDYRWKEGKDGKPGKWDKPPFRANKPQWGAKSIDPNTWADFDTAVAAHQATGFSGIGFAVQYDADAERNKIFIDLDGVVYPETGEVTEKGLEAISLLNTYTELSPSGTGFRLVAFGSLPEEARVITKQKHGKHFEIYKSGKYLTITGNHWEGTPTTIEDRHEEILEFYRRFIAPPKEEVPTEPTPRPAPSSNGLSDDILIQKAKGSENGAKFTELWDNTSSVGTSEGDLSLCLMLAFWTGRDAARMDGLFRQSARMRDKWDEVHYANKQTYGEHTIEKACELCSDVYDPTPAPLRTPDPMKVAAENERRANAGHNSQATPNPEPEDAEQEAEGVTEAEEPLRLILGYPTTDTGNAERFISQHGHRFLYSSALGWMIYDGRRFIEDERGVIGSWEKKTIRSIYQEAQLESDDRRPIIAKWAAASESASKRKAMMEAVLKDGPRAIPSDFDTDKLAFNVQNGTIDLRTGKLHPHRQSDRLSKVSPIRFDPRATCPLWLQTLRTIFDGDEQMVRFFQLALGYALTGLTREQCFFVLFGRGANGKSLILAILRAIMGDYQAHTAPQTLMQKRGDTVPNDVAMLHLARLVTAIETNEGRKMDEAMVKAITGDDPFTARFFRKDFFTFIPQFKIFLATNHKPQIAGTDDGIWRRIRLIPFNVRFWDADKGETGPEHLRADKTLSERIRANELSGILNWAIQGCLEWQENGIPSPQAVKDATGNYRAESDFLAQFIEECAILDERVSVTKGEFHKAFARWAKDSDLPTISSTALTYKMQEKEFKDKRTTGGTRVWLGIGLLSTDNDKAPKNSGTTKEAIF